MKNKNIFFSNVLPALLLWNGIIAQPVITVNPDSFNVSLQCNNSVTLPLTIFNNGASNLTFNISGSGFGIVGDSSILVIQETDAWGVTMSTFLQTNFGITPDVITSAQIPATNFMQYDIIITVGDESDAYYTNISNNVAKFEAFVNAGGILQYQMATQGATNLNLVGGTVVIYGNLENQNTGLIPTHPLLAGLSNPLTGNWANHTYLTNVPVGAQVITEATSSLVPTTIEYTYGQGMVIATGMTWEYLYANIGTYPSGQMLPNSINYLLSLLNTLPPWISLSSSADTILPGDSTVINVLLDAAGLLAGTYTSELAIASNDPVNDTIAIPVLMTVTGIPYLGIYLADMQGSCLDFDTVMENQVAIDSVLIINAGCAPLNIDSIIITPALFTLSSALSSVPPYDTVVAIINFSDSATGIISGSFNLFTNDYDTSICLLGVVAPAPEVCYSPDTFNVFLACGDSITMTLNICNTGGSNLNYALTGGCNSEPLLDSVLNRLNSQYANITALIPNMYLFSDGITGNNIPDGGNDMYDGGNYLNTNLGTQLNYSDNIITVNAAMGAGGKYFTRKFNGLFVFAADINGITYFEINGNNGADGSGNYDGAILTGTACNTSYKGFVKRVYNAGDPSINHLIIIEDNPGITHTYSTNTNDDLHQVTGLTASTRIYYLLYASASGGYINDSQTQAIFDEFLNIITPGSSWMSFSPVSGTVPISGSENISVLFDASGLLAGQYISDITVTSNDPLNPAISVPCTLNVTGIPNMGITIFDSSGSCLDFDTVMENQVSTDSLFIINAGCDTLFIDSINVTPVQYTLTVSVAFIPPYDTATAIITFVDTATGTVNGTLNLFTNDYDTSICLTGIVVPAPAISFDPVSINVSIACCDSLLDTLTIYNTGGSPLIFDLPNSGGLPNTVRDFLIIDHGKGKTSFSAYSTLTTTEAAYSAMTLTQLLDNKVIYFEPDWTSYNNLTGNMGNLSNYVNQGGVVVINIAGNIGDGTNVDPYGTDYSRATLHDAETINLPAHPYITGTPYGGNPVVTSDFNTWSNTDHGNLSNYPPGTEVVLTNTDGTSWIHYPWGSGHVIVTTLTYRWGSSPDNPCNNLVDYALYLANNSGVNWLNVTPAAGTTAAGDSSLIQVSINTCGLFAGTYSTDLIVNSNDPVNPVDTIPVFMTVTGIPSLGMYVADIQGSCLDFDTVMENQVSTDSLFIINAGCDTLVIDSISISPALFNMAAFITTVAPYDTAVAVITFSNSSTGTFNGTFSIFTNDIDTAVCLVGVVLPAPAVCYSPDTFNVTLSCGDSVTLPLTICNSGGSNLDFIIGGIGFGIVGDSSILVIQETDAWGVTMSTFLQTNFGIIPDVITSAQIPATNFMQYDIIITVGDESNTYYTNISNNVAKFEAFVNAGGIVQYQIATQGATNLNLVGGTVVIYGNLEDFNTGLIPTHPLLAGLTNPLTGNSANHTYMTSIPVGAQIITQTTASLVPTTVEYTYGQGLVIATGMTWEFLYSNIITYPSGQMLPNSINYLLSVLNTLPPWISLSSNSGTVIPGDTTVINVTLNSWGLLAGNYSSNLVLLSNDPVNGSLDIPVYLAVSGTSSLNIYIADMQGACLDFDTVLQSATGYDSVLLVNAGCDTLWVDSVLISTGDFSIVSSPAFVPPYDTASIVISFFTLATGYYNGNLSINTSDLDTIICMSGTVLPAPILCYYPDSFYLDMTCTDSATVTLDLCNTGGSNLNFTAGGGCALIPSLQTVLDEMNSNFNSITSIIPNRFDFTDGVTGNNIPDGGNDMYDGGNYLNTNLGTLISYSDNFIIPGAAFGPGGSYFTRKFTGLFVFAADINNISYFEITGNNGADGSGSADGSILITTKCNKTYKGFVKRVYNAGDPSINHLIIVEDMGGVGHTFSTNTNDDQHQVYSLNSHTRIYYLLYASASGGYINDAQTLSIMNEFLDVVTQGGVTNISFSPPSGATQPGDTSTVVVTVSKAGMSTGTFTINIAISSNDPVNPLLQIPVVINIDSMPPVLVSLGSKTNVACYGGNNGSININVTGGCTPYTYSWSHGAFTEDVSGLTAGTYSVTITDKSGTSVPFATTITQPTQVIPTITGSTAAGCTTCNGTATVSTTGGVSPYIYLWDPITGNQTSTVATGLCAGSYYVTVTDNKGCTSSAIASISGAGGLSSNIAPFSNMSCNGQCDGSASVLVFGGTAPYSYSWSTGNTSSSINSLCPGNYALTITDNNGCIAVSNITLTEPAVLTASLDSLNASCGFCGDGAVDLQPTGGTPPYTYQWSNGSLTQDINNLLPGTYTVTLSDAGGCIATGSIIVDFTTGLMTLVAENSIRVYPNPTSGIFYIEFTGVWESDAEILLFNMHGQLIEMRIDKSDKTSFNISNVDPGLYLVRITAAGKHQSFRLNIIR